MKHIKKKGIFQTDLQPVFPEGTKSFSEVNQEILKQKTKDEYLLLSTSTGEYIRAFTMKKGSHIHSIPFPDLTLVYFDSAYNLNEMRKQFEKDVFKKCDSNESLGEIEFDNIYKYYGFASSSLISLYTTLECFINQIIPEEYIYQRQTIKCNEHYSKDEIQRNLSFDEKAKKILPMIFENVSFFKSHPLLGQHIENLKDIRDKIIHPKSSIHEINKEELIKKILNFNFEKTFDAVKCFLNYYNKNYIEECECGYNY